MNTEASLNRPSSATVDHQRLLREESMERVRSDAFWATFDANRDNDRRWAESAVASWRTPAALRIESYTNTATP